MEGIEDVTTSQIYNAHKSIHYLMMFCGVMPWNSIDILKGKIKFDFEGDDRLWKWPQVLYSSFAFVCVHFGIIGYLYYMAANNNLATSISNVDGLVQAIFVGTVFGSVMLIWLGLARDARKLVQGWIELQKDVSPSVDLQHKLNSAKTFTWTLMALLSLANILLLIGLCVQNLAENPYIQFAICVTGCFTCGVLGTLPHTVLIMYKETVRQGFLDLVTNCGNDIQVKLNLRAAGFKPLSKEQMFLRRNEAPASGTYLVKTLDFLHCKFEEYTHKSRMMRMAVQRSLLFGIGADMIILVCATNTLLNHVLASGCNQVEYRSAPIFSKDPTDVSIQSPMVVSLLSNASWLLVLLCAVLRTVYLMEIGERSQQAITQCQELLASLRVETLDSGTVQKIHFTAYAMEKFKQNINSTGLVELKRSQLLSILGTLLTYVIVLIQFKVSSIQQK